jgi:hypothetical protein
MIQFDAIAAGGICPTCKRKLRPLPALADYLSALMPVATSQANDRAQRENWQAADLPKQILADVSPRLKDAARELRCLAGTCSTGGETWG